MTPAVAWGARITGRLAVCVQKASVGGSENVGEIFQLKGQQLFLQDQGRRERKSGHVNERVLNPAIARHCAKAKVEYITVPISDEEVEAQC